jgi:F0F1-type ATP synthase membrane subunit b/b'
MTEHGAHQPGIWDSLFWPMPVMPNFVLFVALMVYVLRGPIVEFFRARATRLREALRAGARAREEAAALRAQLERDVENLPALRSQILADVRATADIERQGLLALGQKAADRIRADARLLADHEVAAARQALRAALIQEAVREATALIRRTMRPEDQERFVRDFVAGAGASS